MDIHDKFKSMNQSAFKKAMVCGTQMSDLIDFNDNHYDYLLPSERDDLSKAIDYCSEQQDKWLHVARVFSTEMSTWKEV